MDGHGGIEHRLITQRAAGAFQISISLSLGDDRSGVAILHVTCYVPPDLGKQCQEYLGQLGLQHHTGLCSYYLENCYYKVLGITQRYIPGIEGHGELRGVIAQLDDVAAELNSAFVSSEKRSDVASRLSALRPIMF